MAQANKLDKLMQHRPKQQAPAQEVNPLPESQQEPLTALNVRVPKRLQKALKERAVKEEITLRQLVIRALERELGQE